MKNCMIYVMSDLHGCYDKYKQMLEKIQFNSNDTLYILGDIVDRGDEGIKILLDMMQRSNVVPLLGNHEFMAYSVLKKYNVEITAENYNKHLDSESIEMFENWMFNGGIPTCQAFSRLDKSGRNGILEYLEEFEIYEEIEVNDRNFVLVHGGLVGFSEDKDLSEYGIHDIIWGRCDYEKQYYTNKFLVTGHTPTHNINAEYKGKIYKGKNHIAIDCGSIFGGRLGCICLDTLEEFYI